jgi:hypothetical protein
MFQILGRRWGEEKITYEISLQNSVLRELKNSPILKKV